MPKLGGQMLTTRGVAAFWLLWSSAFVLMLWAVSPGRTLQDALAAELLQGHLAGGYQLRNPPLYEWLLWTVQQLVGPGPLSYLILRYALIATTGILFYVALLRTVASARLAAAFSLSLVLFFWFGWEIHHSVSHTLALLAAALALFIAALAYAERPTAGGALVLGLIAGVGVMAKWSFLLVLLSLGVALAVARETRAFYREPRTLLVLAGAGLPILPFALWLAAIDPDLVGRRTVPSGRALSLDQALQGVAAFVTGIPLVFLPWIAFVLFFAWRFPKSPPSSPALSQAVAIRLASLTAIVSLLLMATLLVFAFATGGALFGISRFAIHYLFPFSLFAALALAGLFAQRV
jgi:4-amino-4-deoxy-L-arabinose transferase-like glycosyltransferase